MGGTFHFSYEIINAAADRWEATKPEREKRARAKAEGRHDEIDSKDRIVKHATRLRQQLRTPLENIAAMEKAAVPAPVRELAARKPVTRADIDSFFVERVIGPTKDFLSAEFFELGSFALRSVARITTEFGGSVGYGTGFMVSPSLLLTNEHVLENADWAAASVAEFDYQRDRLGRQKLVQSFHLDPARFFVNDKALDFALVAVKPAPGVGTAKLADFGFCPLVGVEGKILVTDPVNIVQHPQGRMKEVVIRENELSALPLGDLDGFAHYLGDTEPGSSGSPVFNDRWEVVALHHSSVPARDAAGNYLSRDGKVWKDTMPVEDIAWIGNEGIRISRIINHLKQRDGLSAGAAALLKELLGKSDTTEMGPLREEGAAIDGSEKTFALDLSGTATITVPVTITVEVGGAHARCSPSLAGRRCGRSGCGPRRTMTAGRALTSASLARLRADARPGRPAAWRTGRARRRLGRAEIPPFQRSHERGPAAGLCLGGELRRCCSLRRGTRRRRLVPRSPHRRGPAGRQPLLQEQPARSRPSGPALRRRMGHDRRGGQTRQRRHFPLDQLRAAAPGLQPEQAVAAGRSAALGRVGEPHHRPGEAGHAAPVDLQRPGLRQGRQDASRPAHSERVLESGGLSLDRGRVARRRLRAAPGGPHQQLAAERFDVGRFDLRQVRISRIEELTGLDFKGLRNVDPMAATGVREVFEGAVAAERKLKSAADIRF